MTQPDSGRKAGDVLVEEGLISPEDVNQALAIQKRNRTALTGNRDRLFGMVLCDQSLVTPMDNYCALDKHGKLMSVGEYLVRKNILSGSGFDRLEARAREEDTPLISFMMDKGVVAKSLLQQILFDLFHIPLRSVSDIVFEKGNQNLLASVIPRAEADQHRCIPLQLNGSSLLVGITDPSNLLFLRGLDQAFPQYRFTPVFIPFSGFTWFYRLLYGRDPEEGGATKKPADLSRPVKSSIVVADPGSEREKIWALFDRYETLRRRDQGQAVRDPERQEQFLAFIRHHHGRIVRRSGCRRVRFSLRQEGGRILVMAVPEQGAR